MVLDTMEIKCSPDRLMVLIPDVLTSIINKGEVTWCYYNPGDLFKEVHLVLCNDDKPDIAKTQKMVGNAKLFIHNLPRPNFFKTIGWQLPLIRSWIKSGVVSGIVIFLELAELLVSWNQAECNL